jgi:hypothetical protein
MTVEIAGEKICSFSLAGLSGRLRRMNLRLDSRGPHRQPTGASMRISFDEGITGL